MRIHELKRGLFVSCQAQPDEPLFGSEYMARMAVAAEMGGAVGVRVNTIPDIVAVKQAVAIPVIGIIKQEYPGRKSERLPQREPRSWRSTRAS